MAFTSTKIRKVRAGDRTIVYGKYVNTGGSTGGEVDTGLSTVEYFDIQEWGASVVANKSVVNEATFPLAGNNVTIVTNANESGSWSAIGK